MLIAPPPLNASYGETIGVCIQLTVQLNTISKVLLYIFCRFPLVNWFTGFWVPYFYYDAWAMYKVYTAKPANIKDCSTVMSKVKSFFKSEPLMMAHHFFLPLLFGPAILVRLIVYAL